MKSNKIILLLTSLLLVSLVGFYYLYQPINFTSTKSIQQIQKPTAINYKGSVIIKDLQKDFQLKQIDTLPTAAGTYDLQSMADTVTSNLLSAFSTSSEHSLPLVANWNVGIPEGTDAMDPLYMLSRLENGDHIVPSWKLDPYYEDAISSNYYETSIKKAAELGLPLVFILPSPESALTKDPVYFNMSSSENPNVINTKGYVIPKLSPFGPNALWKEIGQQWASTTLMSQLQEWYPNPPLVVFVSEDEANKLSWSELDTSSRYKKNYPSNKDDLFKRTLVNAQWIEKYRQMHEGFKSVLTKTAWKDNIKFISYNKLSDNMGASNNWIQNATVSNQCINVWPMTANGSTISFDLSGNKNDYSANSPHVLANNLPFMLEKAKQANPGFAYQLNLDDFSKIDNPQRYRGFTQYALWFLRPSIVRQHTDKTTRDEINPLFNEVVDSVELINYNDILADFWKNGKLVNNGDSYLNKNIPQQYLNVPRWFLLDVNVNPPKPWTDDTTVKVWSFALVKGQAPNREWLIYTQSPEENLTNITVTIPEIGNVDINSTQEGSFFTLTEANLTLKTMKSPSINLNVSNVQVTNITDHSCDVTWEGNPNAKTWLYIYSSDTNGSKHDAVNNQYTYSSLGSGLEFKVYVQGYGSDKIEEAVFTTLVQDNQVIPLTDTTTDIKLGDGITYYFDATNGDNANNGISIDTPWKTLSKLNSLKLFPGDNVLFKRGEQWHGERLIDFNYPSGEEGKPIIFSSYGNKIDPKPIISAIDVQNLDWDKVDDNVWLSTQIYTRPLRFFKNNMEILKARYFSELSQKQPWFFSTEERKIYLYSTTNPNNDTFNFDKQAVLAYFNNQNYIILEGLDLQGATSISINNSSYIQILNSIIGKNAAYGARISNSNNIVIQNNIFDTFYTIDYSWITPGTSGSDFIAAQDGILFSEGTHDSIIHNNYFKNWNHASISMSNKVNQRGIYNNEIYDNTLTAPDIAYGGRIAYSGNVFNNIIHHNLIKNISVRNQLCGFNNYFHHNIIDGVKSSPLKKANLGQGIELEAYNGSVYNNRYEYNTILNCDGAGISLIANTDDTVTIKDNIFKNNYIKNCGLNKQYGDQTDVFINNYSQIESQTFQYNYVNTSTIYNKKLISVSEYNDTKEFFNYIPKNTLIGAGDPSKVGATLHY